MKRSVTVDEIITPSQVAELLKIHVKTVYKLARQGVIAGNRIGRSWRFSKNHILALLFHQNGKLPEGGARGR
ncbi:MAG: helix-turn-helix domain-containing protein [Deltaproteobacteria bacterium]|nr:helix-turn-helix domain-containing protein [Deltaproteobacteria bacterium]